MREVKHSTHNCGPGSWDYMLCCISGQLYGPCDAEYCGGACEYWKECECVCHQEVDEDVREQAADL